MNESDEQRESSARDIELSRRIAETLDRSTAQIDESTRARLAAMRHDALSHSRSRTRRAVTGFALAAGLAAIIAAPLLLQRNAQQTQRNDAAYLSVDPEMLADMDMLQAIGESQ
jgi:cystathionine beta-lyase/cystathionine gamma-synthase